MTYFASSSSKVEKSLLKFVDYHFEKSLKNEFLRQRKTESKIKTLDFGLKISIFNFSKLFKIGKYRKFSAIKIFQQGIEYLSQFAFKPIPWSYFSFPELYNSLLGSSLSN